MCVPPKIFNRETFDIPDARVLPWLIKPRPRPPILPEKVTLDLFALEVEEEEGTTVPRKGREAFAFLEKLGLLEGVTGSSEEERRGFARRILGEEVTVRVEC